MRYGVALATFCRMPDRSNSYPDDALVALGPAAKILGVAPRTMRKYADDGLLPVFRTPTQHRRFRVADLRALLTKQHEPAEQAS